MNRLYKSNEDKMIAGVCGGIAQYLNIDSSLVRLAFVFFGFIGGTGVLLYFIAALVLPSSDQASSSYSGSRSNNGFVIGVGLVVLGAYMIFQRFIIHYIPSYARQLIWPLIFIVLGSYLVWGRRDS